VRVGARDRRHHGRIDDPQPLRPVHAQLGVDDLADRAGRRRVVDGVRVLAGVGEDVLVGVRLRRQVRLAHPRLQRLLLGDLHRQAQPVHERRPVVLGGQVVVDDPRLGVGQRRAQEDLAARLRLDQHRPVADAVVVRRGQALVVQQARRVVELDVGRVQARAGAEEGARLGQVGRQRPAALLEQLQVLGRERVEQRPAVGEEVEVAHQVVLQVLADRQVLAHLDAQRAQVVGRADARVHEQHRRLVGARRQDHLALDAQLARDAVLDDLDADGAVALEEDARDEAVRDDVEVRAAERRLQERRVGGLAAAVALGDLEAAHALLAGAVEVGVVLVAGVDRRLDHRVDELVVRAALAHLQRAADAVELALAALVVLGALEVGQHLVEGPAGGALLGPLVVVDAVAAQVDHRVDRAAAAEQLAARQVQAAAAEPRLGLAEQVPVGGALEQQRERHRHGDLGEVLRSARLDQRDADVRVLRQARGEHAARRSGADDHVVIG